MSRVQSKALPRGCAQVLLAALFLASTASSATAQTVTLNRDIDLVAESGLQHVSQTDGRWSFFGVGPADGPRTMTIGECGCLLAAFSAAIHQHAGGMLPWFPTRFDFFGGSDGAYDFNPRYLDVFFNAGPAGSYSPGWGYKKGLPPETCGVIPLIQALQTAATDGLSHAIGFTPVVRSGFGSDAKDIVNRNLLAGRPTIVGVRRKGQPKADHVMLVAGWDNTNKTYKYLDPMWPRTSLFAPTTPRTMVGSLDSDTPADEPTYLKFEQRIEAIIDVRRGGFAGSTPSFLFGDDPSPVEILMTGPDGRRTGFDPQAGASFEENEDASYWTLGPWSDPLGELPVGASPRFIAFPNAPAGTYHFTVTGTADGPLQLSAEMLFGGTRVTIGDFHGTIGAGEVRKYELQFARTGTSSVAQVSNFTPHAYAGDDVNARTDTDIAFDGRRSFDADSALASYSWDFGDFTTATGSQPRHAYLVPGDYTVTLTVTDADGAIATDALRANVILSQRRPVAHASGPYIGFASSDPAWYVLLDARGSSDPNGEPLTYRWDFGDGSPIRTTAAGFADHLYTTMGVYTMTVVVNDGIEDSAPAMARVEIVQVPGNYLTWSSAVLTPNCGKAGDRVTIALGEFAQFQWWNFGTMGALPPLPRHLPLGLSAPDGQMRVSLPGGEATYIPFHATMLSPGRYTARATFTVPDLPPGLYGVEWAEEDTLPFQLPCPSPGNHAPVAVAGGPYAAVVGGTVTFDGSASTDRDGDFLEYEWDFGDGTAAEGVSPTHSYAHEGRYIVTLTVTDGEGGTEYGYARAGITAGPSDGDTVPPVTTTTSAPPAGASGWNPTDVVVDLKAIDNPGGSGVRDVTFALSGAETGSGTVAGDAARVHVTKDGITLLTYFATDNAGNREGPQALVLRLDRTGPTITGMPGEGCSVWSPNHKLVTVAQVTASDDGSGMASEGLVLTAASSEPENAAGDGNTGSDVVIAGGSIALRAERSGTGPGRVYTVTAAATDRAGNTTRAVSLCVVPHDQRDRP
jgi:PKD repeat protein